MLQFSTVKIDLCTKTLSYRFIDKEQQFRETNRSEKKKMRRPADQVSRRPRNWVHQIINNLIVCN